MTSLARASPFFSTTLISQLDESKISMKSMSASSSSSSSSSSNKELPKKLHETVSKKFNRTLNGKIFTKNFNALFATLMICLNLKLGHADNQLQGFRFNPFATKKVSFSFTIDEAIKQMKDLQLNVNLPATSTTISYSIKSDLAYSLIKKFMRAKFIHTPADRTRLEPKSGVSLQPTPKGCAVIQNFCFKIGLKGQDLPDILHTNFNSMDLICFERHPATDNIIHSEYLIHLLFVRFMGPTPNVWNLTNKPDPIPSLTTKLSEVSMFDFSNDTFNPGNFDSFNDWDVTSIKSPEAQLEEDKISPFHHKFFTNPESDSHVQYYVSNRGIRLFKSRQFGVNQTPINYSFTGKAAVQWFMDCSDILYQLEAAQIMNLLIKHDLIEPILLTPSSSPKKGFSSLSDAFYTLTERGSQIVQWRKKKGEMNLKQLYESTNSTPTYMNPEENLKLKDILEDPGSRFLFRQHLEQDMCVENLDAYTEILDFTKQMSVLKRVLQSKENQKQSELNEKEGTSSSITAKINKLKETRNLALIKLVNDCLSKAYSIYSSYLSYGSPYLINISDEWRSTAQEILLHPNLPFQESFPRTPVTPVTNPIEDDSFKFEEEDEKKSSNSTRELSINIIEDKEQLPVPLTPTSATVNESLKLLNRVDALFKKINQHLYFLLSQDSFPKFINSDIFQQNNSQIKLSKSDFK